MKLIAGLGNPGRAYSGTRHNAGFAVMDELARRAEADFRTSVRRPLAVAEAELGGRRVLLVKPLAFMNQSGPPLVELMRRKGVAPKEMLVVVDDVELPPGKLRLRKQGGAGGHNGLRSIIDSLGADDFPRLRVGVGRPAPGEDMVGHVLTRFRPEERAAMEEAVQRAADAAACALEFGLDKAMNEYNG